MIPKRLADNTYGRSVADRLRRLRFEIFLDRLNASSSLMSILVIGSPLECRDIMTAGIHSQ